MTERILPVVSKHRLDLGTGTRARTVYTPPGTASGPFAAELSTRQVLLLSSVPGSQPKCTRA